MHEWHIEPREYARHEARRGRRHAYEHLHPERTALVVVDMVELFLAENPYARGIVPNIDRLATALRAAGGTVAWWSRRHVRRLPPRWSSTGRSTHAPMRHWRRRHA